MGECIGGRPVTFSLPEDLSRGLFSLPLQVGQNPADHVRAAVDEYIRRRREDPTLADQIRRVTNGYLGSSLQPPDFSGEIAAASERLTADTEEV